MRESIEITGETIQKFHFHAYEMANVTIFFSDGRGRPTGRRSDLPMKNPLEIYSSGLNNNNFLRFASSERDLIVIF